MSAMPAATFRSNASMARTNGSWISFHVFGRPASAQAYISRSGAQAGFVATTALVVRRLLVSEVGGMAASMPRGDSL